MGFSRWWMPKGVQGDLVELYKSMKIEYEYKHGRLPSIVDDEPESKEVNEQYVRPDKAREALQKILTGLEAKRKKVA